MELSPRTAPSPSDPPPSRRRRSPWAYVVLVAVLVGVGVVAYQGLTSASLYFYNVDEAVQQRDDLGDRRIRVQGSVDEEPTTSASGVIEFAVTFNGSVMRVAHDGSEPSDLFGVGTPVVLEGHWDASGSVFQSDKILVKHDEQYEAENGDRLSDAEDGRSDDTPAP